jgi:hypothetical protein
MTGALIVIVASDTSGLAGRGLTAAIALILALGTVPAFAATAETTPRSKPKTTRLALVCTKSTEKTVSGLTKICYFDCGKWEGGMRMATYDTCPDWTPRWRLNQNAAFGPSEPSP